MYHIYFPQDPTPEEACAEADAPLNEPVNKIHVLYGIVFKILTNNTSNLILLISPNNILEMNNI